MSSKLKRKIKQLSGLEHLSKGERVTRARSLLNDSKYKQILCNNVHGLNFKTIDQCLKNVIKSNTAELAAPSISETPPEIAKVIKLPVINKNTKYDVYTKEETAILMHVQDVVHRQDKPTVDPPPYSTYSYREVQALMAEE